MTVYVDKTMDYPASAINLKARKHGTKWCHLLSDNFDDLEELHVMAAKIGLRKSYFQKRIIPHYDLVPSKRKLAIEHGAIEITNSEFYNFFKKYRSR